MIATPSRPVPGRIIRSCPRCWRGPTPAVMGVLNVTPDSFSDGGAVHRAGARAGAGQAHDRAKAPTSSTSARNPPGPTARSRFAPRKSCEGCGRCLADVVALGVPVSIDSMKSAVVALGARRRRRDRQRRLGPAARPRHGAAWWRRATRPSSSCTTATSADAGDRHHAGYRRRSSRARSTSPRKAGIRREPYRARPRHRLRQDAGAEHDGAGPARRIATFRPAASGRRIAQALHQHRCRRRSRISGLAARSPRI